MRSNESRLTVISLLYKDKEIYAYCYCSCGTFKYIRYYHVSRNKTKSCGCYRNDAIKEYGNRKQQSSLAQMNEIFNAYKSRAKRKNIEFSLTYDQFLKFTSDKCYYCGITPNQKIRQEFVTVYNGIDRIDSSKGYSIVNCVTACTFCNIAKGSMSVEDFYIRIDMIYKEKLCKGVG